MRRIIALMKIDLTNAFRDSLVIYVLVAPLLIAGGLRLFLPGFEGAQVTYAVEVPAATAETPAGTREVAGEPARLIARRLAERLDAYGRVEVYASADAVRERVLDTDDVGGFVLQTDVEPPWTIVLEGNEGAESEAVMRSVLLAATSPARAAEYTITQTAIRSPFREYASVGLVMLASLIGGLAVSFSMIDEKEQGVTRAFTVTPISVWSYFAGRGILAAIVGFTVATVGHFILVGAAVPVRSFALAMLASAPLPLVVALLVGGIAKNQIQAIAVLKVVMMVYLTIPFASIAVPRAWHWLFYAFPNYWMFRSFEDIYVVGARSGDLPLAAALTASTGVVALIVLGGALGKQLKPR
jgi:ABC-2 type transport system permease protein